MKKQLFAMAIIGLFALSMIGAAMASPYDENDTPDRERNETVKQEREQEREQEHEFERNVTLKGLENAMFRVRNNETALHLSEVWEKIQAKQQEQVQKRIANLTNVEANEIGNGIEIRGEGKAKLFGFIPWKKEYRYQLLYNGTMENKPKFADFLFKMEDAK